MTTLIIHTPTSCKSHLPLSADGPTLMSKAVVNPWMQGRGWRWGFQELTLTSLSWLYYQNRGPMLKLQTAQSHESETAPGEGSTITAPWCSPAQVRVWRSSPNGWAVTQPSAAFHRALWENTKYFKWEDTLCSQCQTQDQRMVGSSQVLTLRLHLTWLNTKVLCWQRNKSLPKTYSNYSCSQGPYKHQVPLPSSCVSFSFSNRFLKER